MLSNLTVLISAAGSPTMPGFLSCLKGNRERSIRVIGVDMVKDFVAELMLDEFYTVPVATDEHYVDVILEICRKEKVDIYFPGISAEVTAVAKRKHEFEAIGTRVSISNLQEVETANNKLKTYEYLKSRGVPVPSFYKVCCVDDFVNGCKLLGYPERPVCLKITEGSGSRGVRIIDASKNRYDIFAHEKPSSLFTSYEEVIDMLNKANKLEEMMLVEYMPGNEYTVDLLADHGSVVYMVGRENVVSVMSIAQESIIHKNEFAYEVSERIVKEFQFDGNIGFDFMKDENGVPYLMDINPRLTATISIIAAAGVNLPYLRIKQLLGEELPECSIDYGTRMKRKSNDIFVDSAGNQVKL